MRKFILGLIALAVVAAMTDSASARDRKSRGMVWQDGRGDSSRQQYYQEQRPNMLQRMWDMEQRKNAWLRQSFSNR